METVTGSLWNTIVTGRKKKEQFIYPFQNITVSRLILITEISRLIMRIWIANPQSFICLQVKVYWVIGGCGVIKVFLTYIRHVCTLIIQIILCAEHDCVQIFFLLFHMLTQYHAIWAEYYICFILRVGVIIVMWKVQLRQQVILQFWMDTSELNILLPRFPSSSHSV